MSDREAVNLPDVLGAITGGERVNLDVVQCALGVRPHNTPAGRPFDVVILLQNASDVDVDVAIQLKMPDRDAKKNRNPFMVKKDRLVVGLRPAEAGYLILPLSSNPRMALSPDYKALVNLSVKRVGKDKPQRVRGKSGSGTLVETELDEDVQEQIWQLQQMVFSVEQAGRSTLAASFGVTEKGIGKVPDGDPVWHSLWSMRDHVDEAVLLERVQDQLDVFLPLLRRESLFFPLLDEIQTRFRERGGYPLRAGEAVCMAKSMMLVLEQGVPDLEEGVVEVYPEWVTRVCRVLFDQPQAANNPTFVLTNVAFDELLRDAARQSLMMVGTVTGEDFGGEAEQEEYIRDLSEHLYSGSMDFAHAYLPLVFGGLIANTRVVMPQEQPRDTVTLTHQSIKRRAGERDDSNAPIFAMAEQLIDRSLDQVV